MTSYAAVDAGPLIASADGADPAHERSVAALQRSDLRLVIPALVLCEVAHFLGLRGGPRAEAAFFRTIQTLDVEAPTPEDFERMAELIDQYADFPLGGTDASVVALAERLNAPAVITLDRRHFSAVEPRHVERFELLP
ncbi:MAG: PIN domain-containing protein [Thermoleophilaceae bacterium]|nr:PIN domain-containing protein [Thermoleophilaceae bacterium]